MILQRLFDLLFGNVKVRFLSDFSLKESVQRLSDRTERTVFSALFRQAVVGPVTDSSVRLQRVIPMFGNSFKPTFVGRFREDQGQVVLEGRFTMFRHSKVFMTIWLAFSLLWTLMAAAGAVLVMVGRAEQPPNEWWSLFFPLIGLGFFFLGVGFVRGCWWLSRSDMASIASVIEAALKHEGRLTPHAADGAP
jgi:hypothetical protein